MATLSLGVWAGGTGQARRKVVTRDQALSWDAEQQRRPARRVRWEVEAAEDSGTCRGADEVGGLGVQETESENFSFPHPVAVGTQPPQPQLSVSLHAFRVQPQPSSTSTSPPHCGFCAKSIAHSDRDGTDQDLDFRTLDVEGLSRKLSNRMSLSMCSARGSCSWS